MKRLLRIILLLVLGVEAGRGSSSLRGSRRKGHALGRRGARTSALLEDYMLPGRYTVEDMNDPNTPIVIPYELTQRQRLFLLKH
jgi:hypothetical protein